MAEQRKYRLPLTLDDLTIRRLRSEDAADVFTYRSDPAIAMWQYWEPFTAEQVITMLADDVHVQPGMYGVPLILAVEYEGKIIGDFPLNVNIPEHRQAEIGVLFNQAYTGRGLATRALSAILGFGFVQLGIHRISAATFTDNERAWRLFERVGMRREGHFIHDGFLRGQWKDTYSYAMLADEWLTRYPDLVEAISA